METLIGRTTSELAELMGSLSEPPYRARQLSAWIYRRGVLTFDAMTDLPATLRQRLAAEYTVGSAAVQSVHSSSDGTVKYAFMLRDGSAIESVYLPYERWVSACLSTQVGCPANCAFCATGRLGFSRNLDAGEIVEQYVRLQGAHPNRRISHVVFMGMGEPLLNVENVVKAVRLLIREVQLSGRNLTISTVGVVPGILQLAASGLSVNLAISLHAPDDELRRRLIPMARKWSLAEILEAAGHYRRQTGRDVTYEYLLLEGVNDSVHHADALARLLRGLPGAVNVIPYNPVPGLGGFRTPSRDRIAAFVGALQRAGRAVTERMRRGQETNAACGQLGAHHRNLRDQPKRVAAKRRA